MIKKIRLLHIIFLSIAIWVGILVVILSSAVLENYALAQKQKKLATDLNVKIEDYSYPLVFPLGYFESKLRPGMTVVEVHSIMTHYEIVFNCNERSELYYFFTVDDDKAVRFRIRYEGDSYIDIQGEDDDSRRFSRDGCKVGLLGEK